MEDMIGRILEMDKQSRDEMAKLKKLKLDSEQKLSVLKEEKKRESIENAKKEIEERKKIEKVKSFVKLTAIEGTYKKKIQEIEKLYKDNKENWVSVIIRRATDNIGE